MLVAREAGRQAARPAPGELNKVRPLALCSLSAAITAKTAPTALISATSQTTWRPPRQSPSSSGASKLAPVRLREARGKSPLSRAYLVNAAECQQRHSPRRNLILTNNLGPSKLGARFPCKRRAQSLRAPPPMALPSLERPSPSKATAR